MQADSASSAIRCEIALVFYSAASLLTTLLLNSDRGARLADAAGDGEAQLGGV